MIAVERPELASRDDKMLCDRLLSIAKDIEKGFVQVGSKLEQAISLMTDTETAANDYIAATKDDFLEAIDNTVETLRIEVSALRGSIEEQNTWVADVASEISNLAEPLSELANAVAMIRAVAMNARIAAAQITNASSVEVKVFADEAFAIAAEAIAVTAVLTSEQRELHQHILQLVERHREIASAIENEVECTSGDLSSALTQFQRARASYRQSLDQVTSISREASSDLVDIMLSQQAGDNARQRIEHAVDAIIRAPEHIREYVMALAATQLDAAKTNLSLDASNVRSSILALSNKLASQFDTARGGLVDTDRGSGIAELGTSIGAIFKTLNTLDAQRQAVAALAGVIGDRINLLQSNTETVRSLEFAMRLVSFNTAIACSKLGSEGHALSTIASQLRSLFMEMMTQSSRVIPILDEVGRLATIAFSASRIGSSSGLNAIIDKTQQALTDAHSIEKQMRAVSIRITTIGISVGESAEATRAALAVQGRLVSDLNEVISHMSHSGACGSVPASPYWDVLRQGYTMQEERDVHDSFMDLTSRAA